MISKKDYSFLSTLIEDYYDFKFEIDSFIEDNDLIYLYELIDYLTALKEEITFKKIIKLYCCNEDFSKLIHLFFRKYKRSIRKLIYEDTVNIYSVRTDTLFVLLDKLNKDNVDILYIKEFFRMVYNQDFLLTDKGIKLFCVFYNNLSSNHKKEIKCRINKMCEKYNFLDIINNMLGKENE